uniref:Phosphatidylinositol 4-kinase type 2 n=1 Tax=Wuchereria bancrofti TaxID=6293 RepID=A0A1I8EM39_WUCBA
MNLLFMPWISQVHCGNRSPINQSDLSTNSQSVTRIIGQDSEADICDELEGIFSKMNPISKFARKNMKKGSLERKPLLWGRIQTLTGEESGSISDRQNRLSINENYGSVGNAEFANIISDAIHAIREGVYPERIRQGSSGSYFVKNCNGETIGVFKPKNEEPYGQLNPRWMKWIHRIFFPCCFGRSCLLPNQIIFHLLEKFNLLEYFSIFIINLDFNIKFIFCLFCILKYL